MILTTWVKVIKESPKTLLVQEIVSRGLSSEECDKLGLKPAYLQMYSVPTDKVAMHNSEPQKPFRLYRRGMTDKWVNNEKKQFEKKQVEVFKGTPPNTSTALYFQEWDGEPEFEDHCD